MPVWRLGLGLPRATPPPPPCPCPSVATTAPPLAQALRLLDGWVHQLSIGAPNACRDSELMPRGTGEVGWALTPTSPALSPPPILSQITPDDCRRTLQDWRRSREVQGCLHRVPSQGASTPHPPTSLAFVPPLILLKPTTSDCCRTLQDRRRVPEVRGCLHRVRSQGASTPRPPASLAFVPPLIMLKPTHGNCCRTPQDRRRVPEVRGCLHRVPSQGAVSVPQPDPPFPLPSLRPSPHHKSCQKPLLTTAVGFSETGDTFLRSGDASVEH